MNRQEIEAALEADWESVVSFFHNLFHKASNPVAAAPESPPVEVAPPQVVVDPVAPVAPVVPVAVEAAKVDNPYVAYLAKYGNDLWAVMKGENFSIDAAGYALALAAGFSDNQSIRDHIAGNPQLTPDGFDPHKTNLGPSDFGKVFKAEPGTTTYTVNVPNGARAFFLRDGEMETDEMATFSLDDGPPEKCIFSGPIADLTPGSHKVTVACNYEMSFQIQP